MHPIFKSLLVFVVFCSSLAFAQPQGDVVIRTRDGKTRLGHILSETSKGYLLAGPDGTEVIEFVSIIDIRQLAPSAPTTSAAPAAAAPVAMAPMPPPPPPPAPAAAVGAPERVATVSQTASPEPQKVDRKGLHFGIGVGLGGGSVGGGAELQGHLDLTFGLPTYRLSVNLGGLSGGFGILTADNLLQINVGDVYSFGVGFQLGLVGGLRQYTEAGLVLQPAVIKLGDRGQHQISLTLSFAAVSTVQYVGYNGTAYTWAGTAHTFLGYSYLF